MRGGEEKEEGFEGEILGRGSRPSTTGQGSADHLMVNTAVCHLYSGLFVT